MDLTKRAELGHNFAEQFFFIFTVQKKVWKVVEGAKKDEGLA